jgi:hypothetical protein
MVVTRFAPSPTGSLHVGGLVQPFLIMPMPKSMEASLFSVLRIRMKSDQQMIL